VVEVDKTTFNAARICKLYGTVARKGSHLPERPHRLTRLLAGPENIEVVTLEMLHETVAAYAKPKPAPPTLGPSSAAPTQKSSNHRVAWADIEPFVADRVARTKPGRDGATIHELHGCPFSPDDHANDHSGYIVEFPDGRFSPCCHHDHCQGRKLRDCVAAYARALLDRLDKPNSKNNSKSPPRDTAAELRERRLASSSWNRT
jgi:hypothetical protein